MCRGRPCCRRCQSMKGFNTNFHPLISFGNNWNPCNCDRFRVTPIRKLILLSNAITSMTFKGSPAFLVNEFTSSLILDRQNPDRIAHGMTALNRMLPLTEIAAQKALNRPLNLRTHDDSTENRITHCTLELDNLSGLTVRASHTISSISWRGIMD